MKAACWTILSITLICLAGCGPTERNVIVNRPPFFHGGVIFHPRCKLAVINAVRDFANANGMDFLLAEKSLEPGDFNALANGRNLNLKAIRIAAMDGGQISIFVIARSQPTAADRAQVVDFVNRVHSCQK